ncbi:MAG: aminotransferase class I/II-fold pyridoxal phosphate-dependent enzyme [Bacteroidetes bacterium]|nr:aminotransferase class I/II-fold pyridoxal phosphate-dependent enzyme [Bacteroidota bacterium]
MERNSIINTIDQIAAHAKKQGLAHLHTTNKCLSDNRLRFDQKEVVNFGSCSYLGLELDRRLKDAAIQGIENFGTQFSSSRAYVSLGLYKNLEEKLSRLFEASVLVTPTTTLGHIGAIPVLVGANDAVIMDHQVHNSVQTAVNLVKAKDTHVELVRHNRLDLLEKRIIELKGTHNRIWYMADGVYSMYGDLAPVDEIYALLDKYPELWFYVDDAHAMTAFGKNGRGVVLGSRAIHPRMVVAVSLNKAFATGGGALVFPTPELAQKIRNCASTLITSGPMQPSALMAANACVDLHLSGEITAYQAELAERIRYTHSLLKKYGLPDLAEPTTPIFFVAVGFPKVGYNLINRMIESGFYLNLGIFPAVPIKNTGVRFTITRLHTFEQIEQMIKAMAYHYPLALAEEGVTTEQVYGAFKITPPAEKEMAKHVQSGINHTQLKSSHYKTIREVPALEWDELMQNRGIFDVNTLHVLEESFSKNEKPEDNWNFDYFIIRDFSGKAILATYTTCALTKDDMLSHEAVSFDVEARRKTNPYLFTSRTLSLGSQLTEGNHLYINYESPLWKEALQLLIHRMEELQLLYKASTTMMRDLPADDVRMDDFMVENGYFKVVLPESYKADLSTWNNEQEFYETLSKRSKRHFKENIRRHADKFVTRITDQADEETLQQCYNLYMNVKNNSLALNTFRLPFSLFRKISSGCKWDIIRLFLKGEEESGKCAGMVLAYKHGDTYSGVIVGLDYQVNNETPVYRRALYEVMLRAKELGCRFIQFGFSAGTEKRKFGAIATSSCAYMQVKDNFNMAALYSNSVKPILKQHELSIVERGV